MTEHTQPAGSDATAKGVVGHARSGRLARAKSKRGDALAGELAGIGGELAARGLAVSDVRYNGELVEIDVTNSGDPDKGKVNIGGDGYLIWERWGSSDEHASADEIVDIVVGVLAGEKAERLGRDDR
jgi:hypothetical protein